MSDAQALFESNETRLRDRVIDKISEETGLQYGEDYLFGRATDRVETADFKEFSLGQTFLMRFRGAEPFTLFKLKYYG